MQSAYILTKSKIITGLKCPRKLWFDVNSPIRKDSYLFHLGNRLGIFARSYYGAGFDLAGNLNAEDALAKTKMAISDPQVSVIYEAAFLFDETLVRIDVLIRNGTSWEMVEVKSSAGVNDSHFDDAVIQTYIARKNGVNLDKVKISHINNNFVYKVRENYEGLLVEVDISEEIENRLPNVKAWIKKFSPIATRGTSCPSVSMGAQCGSGPNKCVYTEKCESDLGPRPEVPVSILPHVGGRMSKEWAAKGIYDLRHLPPEAFNKPMQRIIQQAHIDGKDWIRSELKNEIKRYPWPRFFMDFETVQQGVPLVENTKPKEKLPFQWSVHRWDSPSQKLELRSNAEFLEFTGAGLERRFLTELIKSLETTGPIFAHNASFEQGILKALCSKEECKDLKPAVDAILERVVCTLKMVREGFYSPKMNGSYSLKDVVKAIPDSVVFKSLVPLESDAEVANGGDAMIAWFDYTDEITPEANKKAIAESLKNYCAKDTFAMYQLMNYLIT